MNNRKKMYAINSKIKKFLIEKGFNSFYFFPHLRFQKDYTFGNCGFDGLCWRNGDTRIYFLQAKTNKPCSKKELEKYKEIEQRYSCVCIWVSYFDKKHRSKKHKGIVMWRNA